jgi:hypothetical protein
MTFFDATDWMLIQRRQNQGILTIGPRRELLPMERHYIHLTFHHGQIIMNPNRKRWNQALRIKQKVQRPNTR